MEAGPQPSSFRASLPARIVLLHPRLFAAAALGLAVIVGLPIHLRTSTRLLLGWDVGAAVYLASVYAMVSRSAMADLRRRASREDEGRMILLAVTVGAALSSLGAIIAELGASHRGAAAAQAHLLLATGTIALSWALIHTMFALHYAHEFHSERQGRGGGLKFPGTADPDYWDFLYFSFVIGMTSQVSDVAVQSQRIRRTVLVHGVVSFAFYATLLALMVNIAASAI